MPTKGNAIKNIKGISTRTRALKEKGNGGNLASTENKLVCESRLKREREFQKRLVSRIISLKEEKETWAHKEQEYQYAISEAENKLQNEALKLEEQVEAMKNEYEEACRSWEARKSQLVENFAATNTAGNEILYENHRLQKEIQDFKYMEYGMRKDHICKKAKLEKENQELRNKIDHEKQVQKTLVADKTYVAYQKEFLLENLETATQKYEESSERSGQIIGRLIGIRDEISDLFTELSQGRSALNAATEELKDVKKIQASDMWQQMKKRHAAVDIYT